MIAPCVRWFPVSRLLLSFTLMVGFTFPSHSFACDCPSPPIKKNKIAATFERDFPPGGSATISNPLSPGATGALKIVALGDSVVWGDGLKPESRFIYRFALRLATLTGRQVHLVSYAHSGARLYAVDDLNSVMHEIDGQPIGDLDSQQPTTVQQEAYSAQRDSDAEVVLFDGCINDVGATKIALPFPFNFTQPSDIADRTQQCKQPLEELVKSLMKDFPKATLIQVGYYRVVSPQSAPHLDMKEQSAIIDLTKEQQRLFAESKQPPPQPIIAPSDAENLSQITFNWSYGSDAFLNTSQDCFNNVDSTADGLPHPPCNKHVTDPPKTPLACPEPPPVFNASMQRRVFLATVEDEPEFSYGAKKSRLWLVPLRAKDHDEYFDVHKAHCRKAWPWWWQKLDREKCQFDVTAHPNPQGADDYYQSLTSIIQTAWGAHPPEQAAPQACPYTVKGS